MSSPAELLRSGSAYVSRALFHLAENQSFFVGIRSSGGLGFYFGEEPVFQFNAQGEFRRGFWRGRRIAGEDGEFHWVERTPSTTSRRIRMSPRKLDPHERRELIADMQTRFRNVLAASATPASYALESFPASLPEEFQTTWRRLAEKICLEVRIAARPHADDLNV